MYICTGGLKPASYRATNYIKISDTTRCIVSAFPF